ncbi:MAG TPA: acyl-homoserine-lactone synthase [Sphingomonas sp.]|nr:acyl-homoserine-lactone synthase [Sphingomonas sp.]
MIVHVLPTADQTAHRHLLDSMFEDRKHQFVDQLGWDVPVVDDRFEIDAYDNGDATYVVAGDAHGNHQGSLRLLPSRRPHILGDLFPELCPFGVPRGAGIAEITRLCLPSRLGTARRLVVRNRLISAMVDHALSIGLTHLTGVVTGRFRRDVLAMGWRAEPLGPEVAIGKSLLGAFMLHIGPDTTERLRWMGIYADGILRPHEEAA